MSVAPVRRFQVAVNAEAQALAWARQEAAPAGAVVIVDHEISPRGRLGRLWSSPQDQTAVIAMVWRPLLGADRAGLVWVAASLGLLEAACGVDADKPYGLWWPDAIVDASLRRIGEVKAEVQLGPGQVTSAVVTARLDLAGLGEDGRLLGLDNLVAGMASGAEQLSDDTERLRASYARACTLTGRRAIARLLPRGATRGTVRGVDTYGRLELVSATGLVEPVSIDSLDRIDLSDT